MSELDDDRPLAPHIRAALLAEGLEGGPSQDARARMAAKLATAVGVSAAALLGAKAIAAAVGGSGVATSAGSAATSAGGAATSGAGGAATSGAAASGAGGAATSGAGASGAAASGAGGAATSGAAASGAAASGAGGAATSVSTAGAGTAATTAKAAALSGKAIALVVGALVVGGGIGVTLGELHGRRATTPQSTVTATVHDAAVAPPIDAPPADAPDAIDAMTAPIDAAPASHAAHRPDAGTAATSDQLARERELIDVARSALRAGDTRLATKSLVEHELRFPSGALTEERRALLIEVAVTAGDRAKAQTLAAQFRSAYPHSVFQARIDTLLQ